VILVNVSKSSREAVGDLPPVDTVTGSLSIVRARDVADIVVSYIPQQEDYCVNMLESQVIQFRRCRPKPDWLASGRLWFDERTMTGRKSEEFCTWANKLFGWFRRHYRRTEDRSDFVGPEAAELSARGVLKLGPPKEGIPRDVAKKILGLE
jgi:hypothetical protein